MVTRLKLFGENHSDTARSYHSNGVAQHGMKEFTSALRSHQRAPGIRLKLFGENHLETADSYHELKNTRDALSAIGIAFL